jgi:2-desacetyl-2-hydroxyethyl bacteriochlorophyllide A dehydrogenase
MATMKAAVWKGIERVEVDEVPAPEPKGPYDVQIKVAACGVCGTDVHLLENKFPLFKPPRIIGHEYTGVVSAVGSGVTRLKVGDRVAAESGLACDRCYFCRDGREHLCSNRFVHPGGFAEYTCITERQVHKLPDDVSFEIGSLAEPVACALRAMDMVQVRSGDVALVQGGGTIGCLFTQLLLHGGVSRVLVSEPVAHRREIVKAVGGIPVDPKAEDLRAFVARETDGLGPEIVFDCVGHPALLEQGIELVQRGGTVFIMGVADPQASATIRPYQIFDKELKIMSSYMRPYTFQRAVRWLPQLNLAPLLGLEYPLAETQEAIRALRQGKGLKIVVKP